MSPSRPVAHRRLAAALFAVVVLVGGASAWQLASSQSDARHALRDRFADRAPVATSAVDGLFRTIFTQQGAALDQRVFGAKAVSRRSLDALARRNRTVYAEVVDSRGRALGSSARTPNRHRLARFERRALRGGYGLSDIRPGATPTIATAVRFAAPRGPRLLVTASPAKAYELFLRSSLKPTVRSDKGTAVMVDGAGATIASVGGKVGGPNSTLATAGVGGTGWHTILTVPNDVLYAPAEGAGRWLPWAILALLVAALMATVWLVSRIVDTSGRLATTNAELEAVNVNLARSNEDLEQFAYVASHDLSSPLRSVAGFSGMLANRYKGQLDPDADRFIGFIEQGVVRMQRIIDDLLLYSRVNQAEVLPEVVDLEAVLEDVERALGPVLDERGAQITSSPLPAVRGEKIQLSQVLQNLLVNAMTYVAPGVEPHVHVSAKPEGAMCRISVTDNGVGIDPEHAERIFKMFQRLHRDEEHPGSGIGLAISKKIVERYGGKVSVAPAAGGGTIFSFTLPAARQRARDTRGAAEVAR